MIKITDKYYVVTDGLNYTLKYDQPGKSKNGEPITLIITVGYYRNLRQAVNACMNAIAQDKFQEKNYTLQEAIKELDLIAEEFKSIVNTIPENNI